jgi:hypothetical protein
MMQKALSIPVLTDAGNQAKITEHAVQIAHDTCHSRDDIIGTSDQALPLRQTVNYSVYAWLNNLVKIRHEKTCFV